MVNSDPDLTTHMIVGIAIEVVDGGWVDGVVISGIQIQNARAPFFIRRGDRSQASSGAGKVGLRGVLLEGIHASGAILTSSITGLPDKNVEDIRLSDVHVRTAMPIRKEWLKPGVPELPGSYPEARMFGWLPASAFYLRHVRGLHMKNISVSTPADEWRSTMMYDDVQDFSLADFRATASADHAVPLVFNNSRTGWVSHCIAPAGVTALASLQGESTDNILFSDCDLRLAQKLADVGGDVNAGALHEAFNIKTGL